MRLSISKKDLDYLMNMLGSEFMRMGDDGASQAEIDASVAGKLHDKLVRAFNKSGHWYLWQLKDREGGVVKDNIEAQWL